MTIDPVDPPEQSSTTQSSASSSMPPSGPLPVLLVTGFLGAGKTTLLRRLLLAPHGLRVGLILNEIGQAGVDQVPEADRAYVELSEGCACCVRNPDLVAALEDMHARGDLDRVVIETTGLADPLPIAWLLGKPELALKVRLDAVICVTDPVHHQDAGPEEWEAQVHGSDVIALTKLDLASPEQVDAVTARVLSVRPTARIVRVDDTLPVEELLDLSADVERPALPQTSPQARHSNFRGHVIAGGTYHAEAFEDALAELPPTLFRAKGIVRGSDGRWASFHVVGGRLHWEPQVAPPPHGQSRVAFFGPGLTRATVEAWLADAGVRAEVADAVPRTNSEAIASAPPHVGQPAVT